MKFFLPEPPESATLCLHDQRKESISEPIKLIRKAKLTALDVILAHTKKRAKNAEMKQIFNNFVEGLKYFDREMYDDIQKERQEKLARRKGVQPQELEKN